MEACLSVGNEALGPFGIHRCKLLSRDSCTSQVVRGQHAGKIRPICIGRRHSGTGHVRI